MKLSKFTRDERTEQVDAYMFHESSPRGFARQGYIDR